MAAPVTHCTFGIIGAGIVGLATARALSNKFPSSSIIVLEKESSIGMHQTSHNSGVIHSGIYYPPESLKAQLCIKGSKMLKKYCSQSNIHFKNCGKLIVATDPSQVNQLKKLYKNALVNKIEDVEWIDDVSTHDSLLNPNPGVFTPTTGIVDYLEVANSLKNDLLNQNNQIKTDFHVTSIANLSNDSKSGFQITDSTQNMIHCDFLISCSGLYSDRIASLIDKSISNECLVAPFRGEYSWLKSPQNLPFKSLVYPVPDPQYPFLGVHITPTIHGECILGPNAVPAFHRQGYSWLDFSFKDVFEMLTFRGYRHLVLNHFRFGIEQIFESFYPQWLLNHLNKFSSHITREEILSSKLNPRFNGVRAQYVGLQGDLNSDFIIKNPVSNSLLVLNAPSPAATSSFAIGEYLVDKIHFQNGKYIVSDFWENQKQSIQ